jgi:hypothetical protein
MPGAIAVLRAVPRPLAERRFRGEPVAVPHGRRRGPIAAYPFEAVLCAPGAPPRILPSSRLSRTSSGALLARPLGVLGVALGTTVPSLVVRLLILPACAARSFGGRYLALALRAWTTPLLATAAVALALRALVDPAAPLGWPALLGLAAATQVVFLGLNALLARLAPPSLRLETLPVPAERAP